MSTANEAVVHLLERIQRDPRLAYYFCPLTESYELLTAAYAEANGRDVDAFRKDFAGVLKFEPPRCAECSGGA